MCTLSVTAYGAIQEEDIDLGLVHASSLLQKQEGPGVTARVFSLYFRSLFAYLHCMPRQDDRRRVYISFQCRYGWHCQFLEEDLKTPPAQETPLCLVGQGRGARGAGRCVDGPGDPALLEELYVRMLASAIRYDRSCAYFSSSVLSAAARGFGKLIQNLIDLGDKAALPSIRLVVNEELDADDVRALTETGDLSKLEATLLGRLKTPKDILEKKRLAMLAWLYKEGLLDIQVGVMRTASGIVHAKFGIATDANHESIVFNGSGNESAQGLTGNYEELEVSTKTPDTARYEYYADKFKLLWERHHLAVAVYPLPEAVRLKLIKFA